MADNNNAIREIPKHDIHVKASVEDRSLIKDLGKAAMNEVVIPKSREAMRNMSDDLFQMFIDFLRRIRDGVLYPDGNIPTRRNSSGSGVYTSTTNYTSYSRPIGNYQPQQRNYRDTIGQRPGNEVKKIWVESEEKARQIIGALREDIDNYGKVKVASLYEMIGERTTMADYHYGWVDANSIGYYYDTSRRGDEFKWYIDLPRPVDLVNN